MSASCVRACVCVCVPVLFLWIYSCFLENGEIGMNSLVDKGQLLTLTPNYSKSYFN